MTKSSTLHQDVPGIAPEAVDFYRRVLRILTDSEVPFLLGGAFAFAQYTGITRDTKDLDLFCTPGDYTKLLSALQDAGYQAELTDANWLAKARCGDLYIDIIFNSGNGICPIDETWFKFAGSATFLDTKVKLIPVEEMIWQKAYVADRYRYDGADICHLILCRGNHIDWHRLLSRMDRDWELLFSHLMLFRYVYPHDRDVIPRWLMDEMLARERGQFDLPEPHDKICRGPLLTKTEYRTDVENWGYCAK